MMPLPTTPGGFRNIVADPPWRFKSNSRAVPGRNAMRHYDCMSLADIAAMPVADIAARDSILWLWITGPFLVLGAHIPIMKRWRFKPTAMGIVWVKLNRNASPVAFRREDIFMGGGFTTRKNAEFAVIGKRGRSVRRDAGVREVIISPVREHSRKPDDFIESVERYSAGPYCELFARESRPGWSSWGNEATRFDEEDRIAA